MVRLLQNSICFLPLMSQSAICRLRAVGKFAASQFCRPRRLLSYYDATPHKCSCLRRWMSTLTGWLGKSQEPSSGVRSNLRKHAPGPYYLTMFQVNLGFLRKGESSRDSDWNEIEKRPSSHTLVQPSLHLAETLRKVISCSLGSALGNLCVQSGPTGNCKFLSCEPRK